MRYFFSVLCTVAWALWFGGVMALFLFVVLLSHTFAEPRKELFAEAATATFLAFERYALVVGAVALIAAFGLRVITAGLSRTILFCLLALAGGATVVSTRIVTPKIVELHEQQVRMQGLDQTPDVAGVKEFQRMHAISGMIYTADAALLLAAGVLLPLAIQAGGATTRET